MSPRRFLSGTANKHAGSWSDLCQGLKQRHVRALLLKMASKFKDGDCIHFSMNLSPSFFNLFLLLIASVTINTAILTNLIASSILQQDSSFITKTVLADTSSTSVEFLCNFSNIAKAQICYFGLQKLSMPYTRMQNLDLENFACVSQF